MRESPFSFIFSKKIHHRQSQPTLLFGFLALAAFALTGMVAAVMVVAVIFILGVCTLLCLLGGGSLIVILGLSLLNRRLLRGGLCSLILRFKVFAVFVGLICCLCILLGGCGLRLATLYILGRLLFGCIFFGGVLLCRLSLNVEALTVLGLCGILRLLFALELLGFIILFLGFALANRLFLFGLGGCSLYALEPGGSFVLILLGISSGSGII